MTKRIPLAGEVIQTPDGDGLVIAIVTFDELPLVDQKKHYGSLRAMFGDDFRDYYFRVSVRLEGMDGVTSYEVWEVEYDSSRDPEDAPWREPRSDS